MPLLSAGEDPALAVAEADNFALGDEAPDPSPCFPVDTSSAVTAGAPLTTAAVTQSQVPVSEGESVPIVPAGPARAILQCFAGQAQLAAALNRQGLFAYGVDRVKHKSALAPVLQMDFSSRSTCDSVLTWLDRQKIAGVMMCIPKHPPGVTHVGLHVCGDRRVLGEELASRVGGAYAGSLLGKPGTPACLATASAYSAGELGCLGPLPPRAKLGDV